MAMNFICTPELETRVRETMVKKAKYAKKMHMSRKKEDRYFGCVVAGCELPLDRENVQFIRKCNRNGAALHYPRFLRKKFRERLGTVNTTKGGIATYPDGRKYVIGRCAEQRACRDIFNNIDTTDDGLNELNFQRLQFSKAYRPRTLFPGKTAKVIPPCANCLAIFQ